MRLFFADLLMMLSVIFGLMAHGWTDYALWALTASAVLATSGVALDWRNGPRLVAYLGCIAIPWTAVGLLAAGLLLPLAFVLRIRGLRASARVQG